MLVLLDECVPEPLRHYFPGFDVRTARFMGYKTLKNGALLAAMRAAGFDLLVTVDQSLPDQQNLAASGIGVILVSPASNALGDILPFVPEIFNAFRPDSKGALVFIPARTQGSNP